MHVENVQSIAYMYYSIIGLTDPAHTPPLPLWVGVRLRGPSHSARILTSVQNWRSHRWARVGMRHISKTKRDRREISSAVEEIGVRAPEVAKYPHPHISCHSNNFGNMQAYCFAPL